MATCQRHFLAILLTYVTVDPINGQSSDVFELISMTQLYTLTSLEHHLSWSFSLSSCFSSFSQITFIAALSVLIELTDCWILGLLFNLSNLKLDGYPAEVTDGELMPHEWNSSSNQYSQWKPSCVIHSSRSFRSHFPDRNSRRQYWPPTEKGSNSRSGSLNCPNGPKRTPCSVET